MIHLKAKNEELYMKLNGSKYMFITISEPVYCLTVGDKDMNDEAIKLWNESMKRIHIEITVEEFEEKMRLWQEKVNEFQTTNCVDCVGCYDETMDEPF